MGIQLFLSSHPSLQPLQLQSEPSELKDYLGDCLLLLEHLSSSQWLPWVSPTEKPAMHRFIYTRSTKWESLEAYFTKWARWHQGRAYGKILLTDKVFLFLFPSHFTNVRCKTKVHLLARSMRVFIATANGIFLSFLVAVLCWSFLIFSVELDKLIRFLLYLHIWIWLFTFVKTEKKMYWKIKISFTNVNYHHRIISRNPRISIPRSLSDLIVAVEGSLSIFADVMIACTTPYRVSFVAYLLSTIIFCVLHSA